MFHWSHDLPSQGDTLEVDLIAYGSKQFEREELDVALAELTVGPAFDMGRFGIDNAALGVYGIGSGVLLGEDFYSAGIGAGTRFVIRPNPATYLMAALEYRHKDYHDSDSSPTASLRDGDELRTFGTATYILSPTTVLYGNAYLQQAWADADYLTYLEGGFTVGPRYSFASPIASDALPWIVAVNTGALFRNYADPDPMIDPIDRRAGLGSVRRRRADDTGEARSRPHHGDGIPLRRFQLRHAQIRQFLDLVQPSRRAFEHGLEPGDIDERQRLASQGSPSRRRCGRLRCFAARFRQVPKSAWPRPSISTRRAARPVPRRA